MAFRQFLAIFAALAVLLAPSLASAAQPVMAQDHHQQQIVKSGHCDSEAQESRGEEPQPKQSCCASMCMGMAVPTLASAAEERMFVRNAGADFPAAQFGRGVLAEIATPPPRVA